MNARVNRISRRSRPVMEAIVFAFAVLLGSVCVAEIWQNSVCKPTTIPATCWCPLGPMGYDRCEGALPKIGACYGDVTCTQEPNSECDRRPNRDANPCGNQYMCKNTPCVSFCIYGDCEEHPEKPACPGRWGYCVFPWDP
jgi:hypothetical protein